MLGGGGTIKTTAKRSRKGAVNHASVLQAVAIDVHSEEVTRRIRHEEANGDRGHGWCAFDVDEHLNTTNLGNK